MPKFRNIGADVDMFAPSKSAESLRVASGETVTVFGDLAAEQYEDAYVVGVGLDARAFPKAQWELVEDKPAAKAVKEN